MYFLPTSPTVGAIFKDCTERAMCCWDHTPCQKGGGLLHLEVELLGHSINVSSHLVDNFKYYFEVVVSVHSHELFMMLLWKNKKNGMETYQDNLVGEPHRDFVWLTLVLSLLITFFLFYTWCRDTIGFCLFFKHVVSVSCVLIFPEALLFPRLFVTKKWSAQCLASPTCCCSVTSVLWTEHTEGGTG